MNLHAFFLHTSILFFKADAEAINSNKTNVLEDASNVTDVKSSPLTLISNDEIKIDSTPICTLLIPKRKQPPV